MPAPVRTRAFGIQIFLMHALGDAISPSIIGAISRALGDPIPDAQADAISNVQGDPEALRIAAIPIPVVLFGALVAWSLGWYFGNEDIRTSRIRFSSF